jgi:hypothetical protein
MATDVLIAVNIMQIMRFHCKFDKIKRLDTVVFKSTYKPKYHLQNN